MLFTIAWRNIWRNGKRSAVILCAIAFGLWAGLIAGALTMGMLVQVIDSALSTSLSHIQIHAPGFLDHKEVDLIIHDGEAALAEISAKPEVEAAAGRAVVQGMASSASSGTGVVIYGIDPAMESKVTSIHSLIKEGTYFETKKRNPVVVGAKLADKLDVRLGNKIVLTAQDWQGDINAGAFRIVGIYKTVNSMFDEMTVFTQREDIDRLLGLNGGIHEIALNLVKVERLEVTAAALKSNYPKLNISGWGDLAPELEMMNDNSELYFAIYLVFILLALVFGITNTMLMSVLERVRELGVVMALGMKGGRIFSMIVLETILLTFIGGILGVAITIPTVAILEKTGIDLSAVSEGMEAFGMSAILYPVLPLAEYFKTALLVAATALIAAIYPGIKAVRMNPVEAIRTY